MIRRDRWLEVFSNPLPDVLVRSRYVIDIRSRCSEFCSQMQSNFRLLVFSSSRFRLSTDGSQHCNLFVLCIYGNVCFRLSSIHRFGRLSFLAFLLLYFRSSLWWTVQTSYSSILTCYSLVCSHTFKRSMLLHLALCVSCNVASNTLDIARCLLSLSCCEMWHFAPRCIPSAVGTVFEVSGASVKQDHCIMVCWSCYHQLSTSWHMHGTS